MEWALSEVGSRIFLIGSDHLIVSMGVSSLVPVVGQSAFDLIRRADALLYAAKRDRRNRIGSWVEEGA